VKIGPGSAVTEYTVFLSSANDVIALRERVDGLIHNAVQPVLKRVSVDARFLLDMWEKTEPRKLDDDETIDDEFVKRAVDSDLVVTLVLDRLGSGTQKEIEAVLASDTEIAMLWFVELDEHPDTPAGKFLTKLAEEGVLRYNKAGRPDSNGSWEAIVRVLLRAILTALKPKEEEYREER
jgi:hypothetical protein